MPRLSSFGGILIAMYYRDHHPPHVHAIYGESEAQVVIDTGEPLTEPLPAEAMVLVREWVEQNRLELRANWARAEAHLPLDPIEPLP
jgi:hypothetical protein